MITAFSEPKFFDVSALVPIDANMQAQTIRLASCDVALHEAVVLLGTGHQIEAKRRIEVVLAAMRLQFEANEAHSVSVLNVASKLPQMMEV